MPSAATAPAGALRTLRTRFQDVVAALRQECYARSQEDAERLYAARIRTHNPKEYDRTLDMGRRECRGAGLQLADYGDTLREAARWYRVHAELHLRHLSCSESKNRMMPDYPGYNAMIDKLEALASEVESRQSELPPRDSHSATASNNQDAIESHLDRAAIAVGGETLARILSIAADTTKSADQKMRDIYKIDNQALGWRSPKWAELLNVSQQAIRACDWWKVDRKRLSRDDD